MKRDNSNFSQAGVEGVKNFPDGYGIAGYNEKNEIGQHPGLIREKSNLEGAQIGGQQKASATQVAGQHYKEFTIQPAYFCYVNNIPYLEATAIKYLCRHRLKNKKEDLLKAKHFIDLLIEFEYDKEY